MEKPPITHLLRDNEIDDTKKPEANVNSLADFEDPKRDSYLDGINNKQTPLGKVINSRESFSESGSDLPEQPRTEVLRNSLLNTYEALIEQGIPCDIIKDESGAIIGISDNL